MWFHGEKRLFPLSVASLAFALMFFLGAFEAKAQLAVSMALSRDGYLVYENVEAKIYFRNLSGRPLVFGENAKLHGSLTFEIIGPDGKTRKLLDKKIANALLSNIVLNPGATEAVVAPVSRMYDVSHPGNYTIHAIISHPLLDTAYKSKDRGFSVFNGIVEWKRLLGVPDVLNKRKGKKIQTRLASVISFYDGKRKLYALKIEDGEFVYCVHRLVQDVEGGLPVCMVDGLSRIHIFAQTGAKIFAYYIYDISGKLEKRKVFKKGEDVNPRMVRDSKNGLVTVVGGEEAVLGADYNEENVNPFFQDDLGGKRN